MHGRLLFCKKDIKTDYTENIYANMILSCIQGGIEIGSIGLIKFHLTTILSARNPQN